jgi:hypothetical protein
VPFASQPLHHEIRKYIICGTVFDVDSALFNVIPDKVKLNIDVLRFGVVSGIL